MTLRFPVSATVSANRWLVDAEAGRVKTGFPVRYGVLERPQGLALIDTGYSPDLYGARDIALRVYRSLLRPVLDPAQDAVAVVEGMGAKLGDVRDIIVTHLHADHICGIARFPKARLHMTRASLAIWAAAPSAKDLRLAFYRALMPDLAASAVQVAEDAPSVPLPWGGQGHDIFGDGSAVSVDLPGHMEGHFGVFFGQRDIPLFYAADADWTLPPILTAREPNWPARLILHDRAAARRSAGLVRRAGDWGAAILLAHDPSPWP